MNSYLTQVYEHFGHMGGRMGGHIGGHIAQWKPNFEDSDHVNGE